jgi:hypothetical protein
LLGGNAVGFVKVEGLMRIVDGSPKIPGFITEGR